MVILFDSTKGVLSAWTLTETKGQCNEVFDSDVEHNAEEIFFDNRNHQNSSETDGNNGTQSPQVVSSPNTDKWYSTNISPKEDSKTTETASIDPDAEWITTKDAHVR